MLDAVLAHLILCENLKRILAMVKVWFINMVCVSYILIRCLLVSECRATKNMLWLEDEFDICILSGVLFMQNEYGIAYGNNDAMLIICVFALHISSTSVAPRETRL